MQPLKKRIQTLQSAVAQAKQALRFGVLEDELVALDEQLNQPEIWNNPDHAQSGGDWLIYRRHCRGHQPSQR